MYFLSTYENRRIKPFEIILMGGGRKRENMEGINSTKLYCKHM
jgi:hypothetical protein